MYTTSQLSTDNPCFQCTPPTPSTMTASFRPPPDTTKNYYGFDGFVGLSFNGNARAKGFFSQETVDTISQEVTKHLNGLIEGKNIKVPDSTITSVMSNVYENYQPSTGSIYSRFTILPDFKDDYVFLAREVIDIIVGEVRNSILIDRQNAQLTKWTTVLGENNPHGLRAHPDIKIRKKRPAPMQFNMNY